MASIHASAVLVGRKAVLIRGPSGSGKSTLALSLIDDAVRRGGFARLVADDRAELQLAGGRLLVRPAHSLAGLIEVRGLGIRRLPYEPVALVGWVVDLGAEPERLPQEARPAQISGVNLPRIAIPACVDYLPVLRAALYTEALPPGFAPAAELADG